MRWILLIALGAMFATGCASPSVYREYSAEDCKRYNNCTGVETIDLGNDTYRIHTTVTEANDELALKYWERRRRELTRQKRYKGCKTLFVSAFDMYSIEAFGVLIWGGQADGRVRCYPPHK